MIEIWVLSPAQQRRNGKVPINIPRYVFAYFIFKKWTNVPFVCNKK